MLVLTYGTEVEPSSVFMAVDSVIQRKPDLEDFWNLESIGVTDDPVHSDEDQRAIKKFKESVKFDGCRYQVQWPWKHDIPDLPVYRELALGRLKSTMNRMRNQPDLMEKYNGVIQDQLSKGVIDIVDGTSQTLIKHVLPHHAVITLNKETTKLRVVYDASAKTRQENNSLNNCLYRGPVMLHDICGILMCFRTYNLQLWRTFKKHFSR